MLDGFGRLGSVWEPWSPHIVNLGPWSRVKGSRYLTSPSWRSVQSFALSTMNPATRCHRPQAARTGYKGGELSCGTPLVCYLANFPLGFALIAMCAAARKSGESIGFTIAK